MRYTIRSVQRWIRQFGFGCVGSMLALTMLLEIPAASARAQESEAPKLDAALELQPGATCLDEQRLLAQIKKRLEPAPLSGELQIRVTGDTADPLRVSYEIRHNGWVDQRELRPAAASCDDLHAMLGLAIALVLDTQRMPQTSLAPTPAQRLPLLWTGQLSISQGMLLDLAYGLQAGADIGLTSLLHLRVEVLGQVALNNTVSGSRGSFDLWLAAAAVELCGGAQLRPDMRLSLCSGLLGGEVIGHGQNYTPNNTQVGAWFTWRSGVRFEARLGLRWIIDLDVISRIYSPAIVVDSAHGQGQLRREPSITGLALSIGPAFTF